MKKFFLIFAVIIASCICSFAQKKKVADPCLSKDPKVRAALKKPCPSAPSPKKNKPDNPPKETDDGDSTDDSDEDSTDSPSDENPTKKPKPTPSKNQPPKNNEGSGAMFFITIEHNGEKTELAYTQFENHDGNAILENEKSNRMTFFYGAGNERANDQSFMFNGMIPTAAKGTYQFGTNGVIFGFMSTKFPNVPVFLCESGSYDISAMPLRGGFVEGTFTAQCIGEVRDDGSSEKYSMSGKFKLTRVV